MDFSADPYVAEQQMKAVIFCLVAFGYIAASITDPLRPPLFMPTRSNRRYRRALAIIEEFVAGLIDKSVPDRDLAALGRGDGALAFHQPVGLDLGEGGGEVIQKGLWHGGAPFACIPSTGRAIPKRKNP